MTVRKDLDFRGWCLDDADFSGARLHAPNLEGTRITDGWLRNTDISGYIDGLRVQGVEVAPLVEAELDRRFPERVKLHAVDPRGLAYAWLLRMIRQQLRPYHPWGIAGSFLTDPARLGLDYNARPTLDQVLVVRHERMGVVKETIDTLTGEEVERICTPPDAPGHPTEPHPVLECLHVILDEEWEHSRYANRDLDILQIRQ